MQRLQDETERDLAKSKEDFERGDWEEFGARVQAQEGHIQEFNERLADLEPDARSFEDALAETLDDVFGATEEAASSTSKLAEDMGEATEGALEDLGEKAIDEGIPPE